MKLHKILEEISTSIIRSRKLPAEQILDSFEKIDDFEGLAIDEIASIVMSDEERFWKEIYKRASLIRRRLFNNKVWIFAPLYVSNICRNECLYCAYRRNNRSLHRKTLSEQEINREIEILLSVGHRRVCLVYGDHYYLRNKIGGHIKNTYTANYAGFTINEVCVNSESPSYEEFISMLECGYPIYYRVFQETYNKEIYGQYHIAGPKRDYYRRLNIFDTAIKAGVEFLGLGVLFGLYDWRYDIVSLIAHARYLRDEFGIKITSISIPRIRPSKGTVFHQLYNVSDETLMKIAAILRISVPWAHIIVSTREPLDLRLRMLDIGVTELSAWSSTAPGGYATRLSSDNGNERDAEQFVIQDQTSLADMILILNSKGYQPVFESQIQCSSKYQLVLAALKF
jgi:2-iminoacetate synthase